MIKSLNVKRQKLLDKKMKEVYKNLFVGSLQDYENLYNQQDWYIIQATKTPCHANALGYPQGQAAPKNHPERLIAVRDNKLILNMVDGEGYDHLSNDIKQDINSLFEESLAFINKHIANNKVLVHCNLGMSRSPSIALMYLKKHTKIFDNLTAEQAINLFANQIYFKYFTRSNMKEYIESNW